jgi:hypothetical protein
MPPPIAEAPKGKTLIESTVEIGYEGQETLLQADTPEGTKLLQDVIADNPKSQVIFKDEGPGELSVEGVHVPEITVNTSRARVLENTPQPVTG